MADAPADGGRGRGGFGRGRGRGRGGDRDGGERGRGGRGGRGERRGGRGKDDEKGEWTPVTKLGRLVKDGKIKQLEHIFLHALPIKEYQILDHFFGSKLKDEVLKIMPVQKQTRAGQRTRFKAFVVIGDFDGHIGLGVKCSKEVATAIRGAIINSKLNIIAVRRGFWGNKIGLPHTVPMKVHGKCGSVHVRLIPAPRGTGVVGAPTTKKLLTVAGINDCYTATSGCSKTLGNFAKATFAALSNTATYLDPTQWAETPISQNPYQEFSEYLNRKH